MQQQLQVQKAKQELEDFKKIHSKTFMYFLEEYEKYVELKRNVSAVE